MFDGEAFILDARAYRYWPRLPNPKFAFEGITYIATAVVPTFERLAAADQNASREHKSTLKHLFFDGENWRQISVSLLQVEWGSRRASSAMLIIAKSEVELC